MATLLVTFGLVLAITIAGTNAYNFHDGVKIKVVSAQELKEALKRYPNAVQLQATNETLIVEAEDGAEPRTLRIFDVGQRVPGDFRIDRDREYREYPTKRDISYEYAHPDKSGCAHIISFVKAVVQDNAEITIVWMLSGGIGQRHMVFLVHADTTNYMDVDLYVYGY